MSERPPVAAGQVYELSDGRELFVRTNPEMGVVRMRMCLSVDTMTERGNRRSVASFEKLRLLAVDRCYRCWRTGHPEDHEPEAYAVRDHEEAVERWKTFEATLEKHRAQRSATKATIT